MQVGSRYTKIASGTRTYAGVRTALHIIGNVSPVAMVLNPTRRYTSAIGEEGTG